MIALMLTLTIAWIIGFGITFKVVYNGLGFWGTLVFALTWPVSIPGAIIIFLLLVKYGMGITG